SPRALRCARGPPFPRLIPSTRHIVSSCIPEHPVPPKPEPPRQPIAQKKLPPVATPQVTATARLQVPHEVPTPKAAQPETAPPRITTTPQFTPTVFKTGGARPAMVVHTGEFGSSAPATVNAPIQKVQTGGFGDPNGIPGQGKPNAHLQIASTGSFDLPSG